MRKGNVIAFGARDPSGIERDRERVVVAFEVQDARAASATVARRLVAEVRKAVQEGMGLTLDDVVAARPGRAAEDVERQAPAREDARALRDGRARWAGRRARDASKLDVAKQAAKSQLSYFKLAVLGGREERKD